MSQQLVSDYLSLVKESGLVAPDQLTRFINETKGEQGDTPNARTLGTLLVATGLVTSWQNERLQAGRHKGFFLGRCRLLALLGTGGMGSVFLAEHTLMRRRVAIKVLPVERSKESSYRDRFLLEARAIAALDHPNIVQAYSVDKDDKIYYMVMEYVEGRDLEKIVSEDGPLDYARAARYTCQAAEGLAHAHGRGMIHRDIKPANLLVNRQDVIKILDLGLARLTGKDERSLTIEHNQSVMGTTDYLAPEQALDSHNVDWRVDIYSLGCTLYHMLSGHAPFPAGTLAQRLLKHQVEEPKPILSIRPDAPPGLVAICEKMMAKKPEDRYQSAEALAEALKSWEVDQVAAVTAISPPQMTLLAEGNGRQPAPNAPLELGASFEAPQVGIASPSSIVVVDSAPHFPTVSDTSTWNGSGERVGFSPSMLSALAAGAALVMALIGWGAMTLIRKPAVTDAASIVLDWPTTERVGGQIKLDGKDIPLPLTGIVEIPTHAGARHLVLIRPGFPAYERAITLEDGQRRNLSPWWGDKGNGPAKLLALTPPHAAPPAPLDGIRATPPDVWQPLFNGKDLTGWAKGGAGTAEFIMREGQPNLCLTAPVNLASRNFGDYHLRFEYKGESGAWGSLGILSDGHGAVLTLDMPSTSDLTKFGVGSRELTYQAADIQENRLIGTGKTLDSKSWFSLTNVATNANVWQRIEIIRMSDSFAFLVNGKLARAITNARIAYPGQPPRAPGRSSVTIMAYGGPAQFRNVDIREINFPPPEIFKAARHTQ